MQNILRHFYSFPLPPFTFLLTSAILHPKVVPRSFVGARKVEAREKKKRKISEVQLPKEFGMSA